MAGLKPVFRQGLLLLLLAALPAGADKPDEYIGSAACGSCHAAEFQKWQTSDHFHSMARPDSSSVLGDFSGVSAEVSGSRVHFFTQGGKPYIRTENPHDGKLRDYPVIYTFGHYPLQQYLIALGGGRLQAFRLAWDSRPKKEGGQRWFDPQQHARGPLAWSSHLLNWNSNCAVCHSTRVQEGYIEAENRFETRFAEINVGCEACHGPGRKHLDAVRRGAAKPGAALVRGRPPALWQRQEGADVASAPGIGPGLENICGGCHSRRTRTGETGPHLDYHDQYRLALLETGLYHPDGQIDDEVFVLGSFLQSRMHQAGVTCNDCHDSHSGQLRRTGDSLCLGCHLPTSLKKASHSLHREGVVQCVDCHMPASIYMGVDARRDHRLAIPETGISGAPDICESCHQQKGLAVQAVLQNPGQTYRLLHQRLLLADPTAAPDLQKLQQSKALPAVQMATLVSQLHRLHPSRYLPLLEPALRDASPLVRSAALPLTSALAPGSRWQLAAPLLQDPSRRVRLDAARALLPLFGQVSGSRREALLAGIQELRDSLSLNASLPSAQNAAAELDYSLGQRQAAKATWQATLAAAPDYVPALLNLADLHRAEGREKEAAKLLEKALQQAGDSAAVQYSLGLSLVRRREYAKALAWLKRAAESADAEPEFVRTFAVALEAAEGPGVAVRYLRAADARWPNDFSLLLLQLAWLQKSRAATGEILPLVRRLQFIAPEAPEARQLAERYGLSRP